MRRALGALVILAALGSSSCGPKKPKVYPVRGEVTVNGWPAHEALIILIPRSDSYPKDMPKPYGQVLQDGSFAISTLATDDGALEGEYDVLIAWKERSGLLKDQFDGKDRLDGAYYDEKNPKLHIKVEAKPNQLQRFELQAPNLKEKPVTGPPAGGIKITVP
jgi:hypothetical protein